MENHRYYFLMEEPLTSQRLTKKKKYIYIYIYNLYKYNLCYVKYTIKTNINPFTFKLSQKNFLAFIFCFTNVGIFLSLRINNA